MGDGEPFFWVEEHIGQVYVPVGMKRKTRTKKMEFIGWGSRPLIEFLESIGIDTSKQISQYDVTAIINKYVNDRNLHHPAKKKRILCDESLLSLFGRKTIGRIKIYDMLGAHFSENQVDSEEDLLFSSEEENDACKRQKNLTSERKTATKQKVLEAPKSCFAAIIPDNIKRVYLKRSLVQDLLKERETFEGKIVGSFVRIRSDPNDYLQKNSHMLVQVLGLKKASRSDEKSAEVVLQVSNFIKDVSISVLSDDNFSEEECEDLCQRIRDGLLKRPTVEELEEKVQALHQDVTNHWLEGELALLQKLIDRANEKGWRKELFEYLERRQLLQTKEEQSRLLREVPKVIADEIEVEANPKDFPDNIENINHGSQESTRNEGLKIVVPDVAAKETPSAWISFSIDSAGNQVVLETMKQNKGMDFQRDAQEKQPTEINIESNNKTQPVNAPERSQADIQVIDLSDDDEAEDSNCGTDILHYDLGSFIWHYADPQGEVQGPFSINSLKRWYDADYFPPNFKVWKTGKSSKEAVLLSDILRRMFPN